MTPEDPAAAPSVRCEGLRFARAGRQVLDLPDALFRGGRTTVLSGPNGSGKTTLLRLIAGLERPTAGRVLVGDQEAGSGTRMKTALSFQDAVFLDRSVRENLELGMRLRAIAPLPGAERLHSLVSDAGIGHLLDRRARQLSGGEGQLVNLVRALSLAAPVTLLDEPFTGLDPQHRDALVARLPQLLRSYAATAIVVIHDAGIARAIADDHHQLTADGQALPVASA